MTSNLNVDWIIRTAILTLFLLAGSAGAAPAINFIPPTPGNGTFTTNTSAQINISIIDAPDLAEFKWNWNGTNYTMYNDSLVLMMNFDNASALGENNTNFVDASRYGANGTASGFDNDEIVSGKYGKAVNVDGSNDFIDVGTDSRFRPTSQITLAAWVNADTITGWWEAIISNVWDTGAAHSGYYLHTYQGSGICFSIFTTSYANACMNVNTGQWYHVVATYDGSEIALYLNGNKQASAAASGSIDWNPIPYGLFIGKYHDDNEFYYYDGTVDEVYIWNRSLSAAEIGQLYKTSLRKYDTDKWQFYTNQSGGGTYTYYGYAKDSAGNSNQTETRTLFLNSPVINSWGNNKTNNDSLSLTINTSEFVRFNATANQNITTWNWYKDGAAQNWNYNNITFNWSTTGNKTVTVNATNANGTSNTITWSIALPTTSTPSFVTANPIRALTRSGAATRVPTNVYFSYNGSIIRINVSLNQSGLTVSGNFANVGNSSSISTSTGYQNASEEYVYTLTATAGNAGIGAQTITITATNTSTGASNVSTFIALMNINPLVFESTLGGTNWTEIEDFTNVTLTFEKFNDSPHTAKLGTLEFLDPMNLADQTTATALQGLGENLTMAQTSMNLNSAANALAAMNVSSRLTMYNLTQFANSPGIFQDGVPVVMSGQNTNGGAISNLIWYPSNSTLVFQVSHWTNYSSDGQPPAVTFSSPTPAGGSTNTTGNVTIQVSLNENGTARLNWLGVNETMTGISPDTSKNFRINKTGLLSGNYTFKVYANDSVGNTNVTETRTITVNRTNSTSLAANISLTTFIVNTTINITSPSGNVTVTIPNGTNASVSGAALTNVSIDSLAQVNSTFVTNLSSSDVFIGENLTLGPDGAQFSPDIQINFSYTEAQLTAAGISESELRVKFYNTTNNTWVTQTTYRQNTTGNYIIVNVSHFSTFALLGTATTTTTSTATTGAGSGGGSGGGGVTTSEPFENIEMAERYDKNLIANTPVTYRFAEPEHSIYEVVVTGTENEDNIALRCEALKGTSKLVTASAPGTVYKNENIWIGTKRIKEATIRFKVENSWISSNNLATSDVKMVRWDGSQWVQLETSEKGKDNTYTIFEAKTPGFSSFAIVGRAEKEELIQPTVPQPQPSPQQNPLAATVTVTTTSIEVKHDSASEIITGIFGLALPGGKETVSLVRVIALLSVVVILRLILKWKRK